MINYAMILLAFLGTTYLIWRLTFGGKCKNTGEVVESEESNGEIINTNNEFREYLKGKKPTTNGLWMICAALTFAVVIVSAWVNWSFGATRGGFVGGLIALSLDVLLFISGVRTWRGHGGVNKIVDWAFMLMMICVGILCVVGFFSTQNKQGVYDFQVSKNEAMTRAVSTVSSGMSDKAILDVNYMNNKMLANMKAPERSEDQFFITLAGFTGAKNADDASFIFNVFIGIVLVIGSVLATTRLNSYYCPALLKQLNKSIQQNKEAMSQERTTHATTTPTPQQYKGTQEEEQDGGPAVRANKDDKFNEVSMWIGTLKDGDNIGAKELKNKSRLSDSELPKLKNRLIKEGVLEKKKHGSSWRYNKPKTEESN
jgi:hypothetical protein